MSREENTTITLSKEIKDRLSRIKSIAYDEDGNIFEDWNSFLICVCESLESELDISD